MTAEGGATARWQDHVRAAVLDARTPGAFPGTRARWRRIGGTARDAHWLLDLSPARCFVKLVDVVSKHVLEAEAMALREIAATQTVRVPNVIACSHDERVAYLALEWLDIVATGGDASLGRALARLHATTSTRFGWSEDNTIGLSPQVNAWGTHWSEFFRDQRLRIQLELAARNGYRALRSDGERLLERIPDLLAEHRPQASLLHGDLWSGNAGILAGGSPTIFDPAAYYGDRETDIAMTALFGGFDDSFYAAYASEMPLPSGHERRRTLYNLYHVLNHVNIFGQSYLPLARRMLGELLA